jgi:hypothetical protein
MTQILQMNSRPTSTEKAKLTRYIRDMSREMAKMANTASLDLLAYLLYLVVAEAQNQSGFELTADPRRSSAKLAALWRPPIYLSRAAVAQLPRMRAALRGYDRHD